MLWFHVVKRDLLDPETLESANSISRRYGLGPISYLVCFALSWINVPLRLALNIGLAVFYALPPDATSEAPDDADCNEIVAFLDSPGVR